jgi:NAD(P)-dependent dehydrogenase (short-subunit alcohol dehydrogenase family)
MHGEPIASDSDGRFLGRGNLPAVTGQERTGGTGIGDHLRAGVETMNRMEGKVVVITGAAKGIGRTTCEVLAREGALVAATDVDMESLEETVAGIEGVLGAAHAWELDVTDEGAVERVMAEVHDHFGRIDVLVNNAGIAGTNDPTHQITAEQWRRVMAVNVEGVFFCTKHVIPYLRQAGGGSIVNLSSIYGLVGAPDAPPYHASKGAVRLMSKTDAMLYAGDGIRVNSVHPGYVWTPMVEEALAERGDVEEGRRQAAELHPLGRIGEPREVADAILFLASDESSFVTGSELVVDGGYTAR